MGLENLTGKLMKSLITPFVPSKIGSIVLDAPKKAISDSIAAKIKLEATMRAYQILAGAHRSLINTILWQNALLLFSILPVYFLHSAIPFYIAYACVATYTTITFAQSWPQLMNCLKTRSLLIPIKSAVLQAIKAELCQLQFVERKVVEYLGPDLEELSSDIARQLLPDIRSALINMGLTLIMAFVAFRLTAIPMLEHRAL
ncbi:hypothetical protein [Solimicrobium silvestre]|uniref:Uncharacterized protein n=1 Tax=Solimicrobium silvestre TaxID=2099400 RepID=A0A2S9H4F8_9BURK|nr:hypothetical protein [Solimicrobium silvestre]PRC94823.1 hypothetical protein S2091_0018 [Solimicrobium silvestre]